MGKSARSYYTQTTYIEYLLSTPTNYTRTHLTAHLPDVSHDQMNRFLRTSPLPTNQLHELVQPLRRDSTEVFLLVVVDSVRDKRYSRFIDVAKRPYPGNAHDMVTGIGLVSLMHGSGGASDFLPPDYRVCAPDYDEQPKNAPVVAMFDQVVAEDKLLARTIWFDSWYVGSTHMKRIRRAGWTFFTTLKSNRLVSLANFTQTKEGFVRLFAQSPDITRTLVPGSLEVYPVKNYGAMHLATQRFCHGENGREDCGNSKFVMVWQQQTGTWRITRAVSYDH